MNQTKVKTGMKLYVYDLSVRNRRREFHDLYNKSIELTLKKGYGTQKSLNNCIRSAYKKFRESNGTLDARWATVGIITMLNDHRLEK